MKMQKVLNFLSVILLTICIASVAESIGVRVDYTGTITYVELGDAWQGKLSVSVGDRFYGSFFYDTSTVDSYPDPNVGHYKRSECNYTLSINELMMHGPTSGSYFTVTNSLPDSLMIYDPVPRINILPFPYDVDDFSLVLTDSTGSVFLDDSLPTNIGLGSFDKSGIALRSSPNDPNYYLNIKGDIDTLDSATFARQILSSFNFSDEDWVAECANLSYAASSGNPGGHITLVDNCPSSTVVHLPPKFLGDLSLFSEGVMAFDVRSLYPISTIGSGFGRIQMNGPVLNATHDFAPYPQIPSYTDWTTYYVPFTAEAWAVSGSDWKDLIANVASIQIVLGDVAFDNFRICQGLASTFDINEESWAAYGALLEYLPEGGNSGGFITLEDNAGDTFIVRPPAKFIGNLARFNGGLLSYDIKSLSPTPLTEVGSGFGRITLIGGGHQAMLDYAPYPPIPSNLDWTRYDAPMTSNAWDVTEEIWQVILTNVTDMYIVLDGASDTIALDNFTIMPPVASIQSFAAAFGRSSCTGACYAEDLDGDRDVDGKDLAAFLGM